MPNTLCSECLTPLAPGHECPEIRPGIAPGFAVFPVPPSAVETGHEWVKLRECADMLEAELVAGFLDSGGLHVHVESRTFRQEPMPMQRSFSCVVLWVPVDEADEARRVLAASADVIATCDVCGGIMDDAVCPACAEAAPAEE